VTNQVTALPQGLDIGQGLAPEGVPLALGQGVELLLFLVGQAQVLHGMLQVGGQDSGYWIVVWRGLKSTPVVNSLLGLGALAPANCRRPHLDLVRSRRRDLRDDLDGFIQPLDLDEIKPGQPPRVPAKRAVGDGDPPLRTRLDGLRGQPVAGLRIPSSYPPLGAAPAIGSTPTRRRDHHQRSRNGGSDEQPVV
jgi:hypothetical protein